MFRDGFQVKEASSTASTIDDHPPSAQSPMLKFYLMGFPVVLPLTAKNPPIGHRPCDLVRVIGLGSPVPLFGLE